MKLPAGLTLDAIVEAAQADEGAGFCLACGEEASEVEPDARAVKCELCDERQVYGAEELALLCA